MFYQQPFSIFPNSYIFPLQTNQTYQFSNLEIVNKLENGIGYVKCEEFIRTILRLEDELAEKFQKEGYDKVEKIKNIQIKLVSMVVDDTVKLYGISKKNISLTITGLWYQQHSIGLLYKVLNN